MSVADTYCAWCCDFLCMVTHRRLEVDGQTFNICALCLRFAGLTLGYEPLVMDERIYHKQKYDSKLQRDLSRCTNEEERDLIIEYNQAERTGEVQEDLRTRYLQLSTSWAPVNRGVVPWAVTNRAKRSTSVSDPVPKRVSQSQPPKPKSQPKVVREPTVSDAAVRAVIDAQLASIKQTKRLALCGICRKPLLSPYVNTCFTCRPRDEQCTLCGKHGAPASSVVTFTCEEVTVKIGDNLCLRCMRCIMENMGNIISLAKTPRVLLPGTIAPVEVYEDEATDITEIY